jgi:hypothetical protein
VFIDAAGSRLAESVNIREDLKNIFSASIQPAHVVYFCEADLPVAKRHALEEHCLSTYNSTLNIFDGEAISDILKDRDIKKTRAAVRRPAFARFFMPEA